MGARATTSRASTFGLDDGGGQLISKTAQYALRSVLRLAEQGRGETLRASEIAGDLGIPSNYLSKILHALARAGVLRSERGPHGGFRLARPADEMVLAEILEPLDPDILHQTCLLGRPQCSDDHSCAVHDRWKRVREPMLRFFRETRVADVLADPELGEALAGRDGRGSGERTG